jgi:hypothetical protein
VNVRLSQGEVRVRLDRADAEALARGEALAGEVALAGGPLRWRVEPRAGDPSARLDGAALTVTVPPEELRELLARPPSKDLGVQAEQGGVAVVVEIDAHSGKRR